MTIERHFGWAGRDEANREWDWLAEAFPSFFIAGQTRPTAGRAARLWELVRQVRGADTHHAVEACFKAVGRALRAAIRRDGRTLPTTKGVL